VGVKHPNIFSECTLAGAVLPFPDAPHPKWGIHEQLSVANLSALNEERNTAFFGLRLAMLLESRLQRDQRDQQDCDLSNDIDNSNFGSVFRQLTRSPSCLADASKHFRHNFIGRVSSSPRVYSLGTLELRMPNRCTVV
jgi:hypothetical protein